MKAFYSFPKASLLLACTLAVLVSSCEKKESDRNDELLDGNILKSESAYKNALSTRGTNNGEVFTIEEIKREGSSLTIRVLGGCSEESYRIIWNGLIAESHPAQVYLVLTHEPAGDICQTSEELTVTADLRKIVGEAAGSGDYIFHVANGSIRQDKSLNPDGSVSSEE